MTGAELCEYIKHEGLEECNLGIRGQTPIIMDENRLGEFWIGLASTEKLKPSDICPIKLR